MSSQLPNPASRRSERAPLHKVITRHNGLLFHSVTVASFLESTVPLHANALMTVFAIDPEVRRWLEEEWSPRKAACGQRLRAYVEATWEGFDWAYAYGEFYEAYRPRAAHAYAERPLAQVALSLCAAAAQTAALYRGLAAYADDPELRRLLREAGEDEACSFDCFRALFERLDHVRPLSALESYRTIVRVAADARDGAVRLAFARMAQNWCDRPPFPEMEYPLFIRRTGCVLDRHLGPGMVQRVLFRPWLKAPSAPVIKVPRPRPGDRLAPVPRLVAAA
jgi:hypothetical protein